MLKNLILIRHGETAWNLEKKRQGHTDIPLNTAGLRQADLVAARLAHWEIDAIYSSDLVRASVSAEKIAAPHNLSVQIDPVWRERDIEKFAGHHYHDESRPYYKKMKLGVVTPYGGESDLQLATRIMTGFAKIESLHATQNVLIMSHGGSISALINGLLNIQSRIIRVGGNTCISQIRFDELGPRLTLLNDMAHLEPCFISPKNPL